MLTALFQNIREFAISKQGLETANSLIPSESIVGLRESEKTCLVLSFQELLNFDDTVDFAAKTPKIGTKVQQKGRTITCDPAKTYPCGNVCRSQSKDCKTPIDGQAGTYAGFLELQAKKSGKLTPGKDDSPTKTVGKYDVAEVRKRFLDGEEMIIDNPNGTTDRVKYVRDKDVSYLETYKGNNEQPSSRPLMTTEEAEKYIDDMFKPQMIKAFGDPNPRFKTEPRTPLDKSDKTLDTWKNKPVKQDGTGMKVKIDLSKGFQISEESLATIEKNLGNIRFFDEKSDEVTPDKATYYSILYSKTGKFLGYKGEISEDNQKLTLNRIKKENTPQAKTERRRLAEISEPTTETTSSEPTKYTKEDLAPMSGVEKDKLFKPVLDKVNRDIEDHPAYKDLKDTVDRRIARTYDGKNGSQTKEKIAKQTPRDYLQDLVFDTKSAYGKKVESLQGQIRRDLNLPKQIVPGSNLRNNSLDWDKIYLNSQKTTETKKQGQKLEPRDAKQQEEDQWNLGIPTDKQAKDRLASSLEYVKKIGYKPTEQELADLNSGDGRLFQKANDSIQENSYDIRAKKVADIRKEQKQVESQIDDLTAQRDQLKAEAKKITEANSKRVGRAAAKRVNAGLDADGGDGRSLNNPKVREQVNKLDQEARGLDNQIGNLMSKRNGLLVDARELGAESIENPNNPRNKKPQDTGKTEKPAVKPRTVKLKMEDGGSVDLTPDDIKVISGRDNLTPLEKARLAKTPNLVNLSKQIAETGDPALMKKYEGYAISGSVASSDGSIPRAMLRDLDIHRAKKEIAAAKESGDKEKQATWEAELKRAETITKTNLAGDPISAVKAADRQIAKEKTASNIKSYEDAAKTPEGGWTKGDADNKRATISQGLASLGGGLPDNPKMIYDWSVKHNVDLDDLIAKQGKKLTKKAVEANSDESLALMKALYNDEPLVITKPAASKSGEERSRSTDKPAKIQADIKSLLGTDKTVTLDELQTQLGYKQSKYGNSPETNPLNKALKELRDSGDIEQTNEGQRGQPRFRLVSKEQDKPALTLDGNYKDPVAPIGKEDTGKIKLADVKSAQDKEDYAKQELAAAKKSGDKKRIADWEDELKKAKIANVKTSQKAQKASQTSLFNPLAYDDELNKAGLLKGMFSENFTWTKEAIEFYKNYKG